MTRAWIFWLFVAASVAAVAPAAVGAAEPLATLPMLPFRQLVVVPVHIGASPELRFVLDSGSPATTLNDLGLAASLGLHTRPLGIAEGFAGARLPVQSAPDVAIMAGGVLLMRSDLLVHHVRELGAAAAGQDIHGLLGADLFARYAVEIDPAKGAVLLHPPSSPLPFAPVAVVEIEIRRGRPLVRAEISIAGSRPVSTRLLLDTGAEAAVVLVEGAKRRLRAPADGARIRVTGVGGGSDGVLASGVTLKLGAELIGDLDAAFVDRSSLPTTRELRRVDGVLGNGVLGRYRTWIDLSGRRLAMAPLHP